MLSSLPIGDESAMNFEGLGVFFRHIHWFPQHFCALGANFAENVSRPSVGPYKLQRNGPMGLAYGGAIIRPARIIRTLCTPDYAPPILYIRSPAA
jgi:hypothetical protein